MEAAPYTQGNTANWMYAHTVPSRLSVIAAKLWTAAQGEQHSWDSHPQVLHRKIVVDVCM